MADANSRLKSSKLDLMSGNASKAAEQSAPFCFSAYRAKLLLCLSFRSSKMRVSSYLLGEGVSRDLSLAEIFQLGTTGDQNPAPP